MKEEILIKVGKYLMGSYARCLLKFQITIVENPPEGAKLFASNHPTTTDPFFISLLTKEPVRILITANVFEIPVFRSYLSGCGHIPVERRKGKGKEVVALAVDYLNNGKNVGIFPEGDLSPETSTGYGVLPARYGVARIALQSGKPVIPVGIGLEKFGIRSKEYKFSDRDTTSRWITKGAYEITIGAPMYLNGDADNHSEVAAAAHRNTAEIRKMAVISESRLPQFRVRWHAMHSYRKMLSTLGG